MSPTATTLSGVERLRALASLFKLRISAMVTLSAAAGYLSAATEVTSDLPYLLLGVMLLCAGSVALNHVQDVPLDRKMARTRHRPIPAGHLSVSTVVFLAVVALLLGLAAIASISGREVVLMGLGLGAVIWYNGVYYYIKRHSAFAAVPGALIGALPPLMGWVAAGMDPTHPFAVVLGSFFFLWQIPHFWLLQINHSDEYKAAGLPTLRDHFQPEQLNRVTTVWIWATAAGGILLPMLGGPDMPFFLRLAMVIASIWLVMAAFKLLAPRYSSKSPFLRAFTEINGYGLAMMVCLSLRNL